jgi:hypothetical protein
VHQGRGKEFSILQTAQAIFNILPLLAIIVLVMICYLCSTLQWEGDYERAAEEYEIPHYVKKELDRTETPLDQWMSHGGDRMAHQKKPIPGVARTLEAIQTPSMAKEQHVRALRGGEFIGNRMRYKIKILNESPYTITDVRVFLISYPSTALKLVSEDDDAYFSKIEPNGFRSPSFDFLPTQDCVKGEICGGVSFVDMKGQPHTLTAKPFIIRSVCDLLLPNQIAPKEFELKLKQLECGELAVKVTEWTPEEMFEKALRIVQEANFYEVSSNMEVENKIAQARISGLAKGKYTGKSVAVELYISGMTGKKGAGCTIKVLGEDQAMIMPAIDDLRERLNAWSCPMCSSPLTLANVEDLKTGKVIKCPFCGVSIGR